MLLLSPSRETATLSRLDKQPSLMWMLFLVRPTLLWCAIVPTEGSTRRSVWRGCKHTIWDQGGLCLHCGYPNRWQNSCRWEQEQGKQSCTVTCQIRTNRSENISCS